MTPKLMTLPPRCSTSSCFHAESQSGSLDFDQEAEYKTHLESWWTLSVAYPLCVFRTGTPTSRKPAYRHALDKTWPVESRVPELSLLRRVDFESDTTLLKFSRDCIDDNRSTAQNSILREGRRCPHNGVYNHRLGDLSLD